MARQATSMKKPHIRSTQAYKDKTLALANRVGASAAARELGLQPTQLYQWRSKAQSRMPQLASRPCRKRTRGANVS